jgi:hypothetical protein
MILIFSACKFTHKYVSDCSTQQQKVGKNSQVLLAASTSGAVKHTNEVAGH